MQSKFKIERYYKPLIRRAIKQSVTGLREAITTAVREGTPDTAKTVAKRSVSQHLKIDPQPLAKVLNGLYQDAGYRGTGSGMKQVGIKKAAATEASAREFLAQIDWSTWRPGNKDLADKALPRLKSVLQDSEKISSDIGRTTRDRIADAIAYGIENGDSYSTTGDLIDFIFLTTEDIIDSPMRADTIAITETSRSFNEGALDSYAAAGLSSWTWLAYEEACDECSDNDGVQFSFDDETPPAHPECRCAVLPSMEDSSDTSDTSAEEE